MIGSRLNQQVLPLFNLIRESDRLEINIHDSKKSDPSNFSYYHQPGFDDFPESAYFYPSLTTISQDLQLLGGQAVQNIVEMIQARRGDQTVSAQSALIRPRLVVRESSKRV